MAEQNYGGDQIQILKGLEAVRKRPGMYIGSTSGRGLHHLVYEIVDNAVDEALAGYCNVIKVFINKDNSITVTDNGRGVPVDINHETGKPAIEVVYTMLHAGGKFGGGGYKVSGGPHSAQPGVVGHILHKHTGHKHGTETIYSRQRRCAETVPQRNCVRIFHTDRLEHYYPPCHFISYSQPTKPEFVQFQQFNDRLFLCIPQ